MLKGTIDLLILSLLLNEDSYGYQISRKIKERTSGSFELQEATLYLSLKRLEKNEAITSYWGKESQGGRRKYYRITDIGKKQYIQYSEDWKQMVQMMNAFI
ncbi:PadR family transcriptional regulator [Gracilibacillus dipsosauri]|uniref:PadR family transcriptional regulator n=2 Tax=Bacillaceae TaxID=186817 RepID=A0A317KZT6_9BACI|nr:PadR family transcriptional regulator [Gracilibacillus dipsosauri]